MTKERLIWIAIILAILAIAVFIGRRDGRKLEQLRNQSELLERQVRDLSTARDVALSRAKAESEQRTKLVLQANSEQTTLKAEIKRLKKRRTVLSTLVAGMDSSHLKIDSTAILANCDSLTEVQDSIIFSLESEKTATTASFNRQLAQMDSAMTAEKAISETWRAGNQESNKKLRRSERRKRFWRSIAVVATVGVGALLISGK